MTLTRVKDGTRSIEFDGTRLAHATTDDGTNEMLRWTELSLHRTSTGKYVIEKVGQSCVYHAADTTCKTDAPLVSVADMRLTAIGDDNPTGTEPCPKCNPPDYYTDEPIPADAKARPEQPRTMGTICDTPQAVLNHLYGRSETGAKYLSHVSRRLLQEASEADPAIADVYLIERI